jgi:chromosome partitioning protein
MRIRRRDKGSDSPSVQQNPVEHSEPVLPTPPVSVVAEPHANPSEPPAASGRPPFDQALISPAAPAESAPPRVAPAPAPAPVPAPAPAPPPPPPPEPVSQPVYEAAAAVLAESEVIKRSVATAAKPAAAEPAAAAPQMRTPSIRSDADALLDGLRPAQRELPRVIAIANQKGGVGKTTTTVNLGAALAEIGYRVLVIDLDPQGNATTGLGIDARNFELSMYDVIMRDQSLEDCIEPTSVKNLFVAPATIDLAGIEIELVPAFSREMKLKKAIDTVVDDFDFILIDCPPSLGLITVNGLAAAGEVMVPIQCEYYALEGLSQLLRNVNLVSSNLNESLEVTTIVLTMFDARTRLSIEVANEVRLHFADRVCQSVIPRTVRLSEAPSFGQPITVFDPTSRGAVAYRELAKEVSNGAPQRAR